MRIFALVFLLAAAGIDGGGSRTPPPSGPDVAFAQAIDEVDDDILEPAGTDELPIRTPTLPEM